MPNILGSIGIYAPYSDVRSSYRCEVFATEIEIQALSWTGLASAGEEI
jgi:hypothetical protein